MKNKIRGSFGSGLTVTGDLLIGEEYEAFL